jgi:hypothetical protein
MLAQAPDNLSTCGITVRVQNTVPAMSPFSRKQKLVTSTVESGSPLDELLDLGRTFFYQSFDGFNVTKTVARNNGVLFVQLEIIVIA